MLEAPARDEDVSVAAREAGLDERRALVRGGVQVTGTRRVGGGGGWGAERRRLSSSMIGVAPPGASALLGEAVLVLLL